MISLPNWKTIFQARRWKISIMMAQKLPLFWQKDTGNYQINYNNENFFNLKFRYSPVHVIFFFKIVKNQALLSRVSENFLKLSFNDFLSVFRNCCKFDLILPIQS